MGLANKWEGKGFSQEDIDANNAIKEALGIGIKVMKVDMEYKIKEVKIAMTKLEDDRLTREVEELMADIQRDSDAFGAFS